MWVAENAESPTRVARLQNVLEGASLLVRGSAPQIRLHHWYCVKGDLKGCGEIDYTAWMFWCHVVQSCVCILFGSVVHLTMCVALGWSWYLYDWSIWCGILLCIPSGWESASDYQGESGPRVHDVDYHIPYMCSCSTVYILCVYPLCFVSPSLPSQTKRVLNLMIWCSLKQYLHYGYPVDYVSWLCTCRSLFTCMLVPSSTMTMSSTCGNQQLAAHSPSVVTRTWSQLGVALTSSSTWRRIRPSTLRRRESRKSSRSTLSS